jgi:rod shape-determining protein MreD
VKSVLALTVFGGGVAHLALAPVLRVADVAPDIPLLVLLLLALRRGPEFGALAGFAAGLLQDAAGGGLIGVQALTKSIVGFAIGSLGARFRVTQPLVQVPGLVLLSAAEGLGRFIVLKLFHFPASFGDLMAYVVLPQALYNGFLGAALVFALAWTETFRQRTS